MAIDARPESAPRANRPLIFSAHDAELIGHLHRVRHVTTEDLAIALGRHTSTIADRLTALAVTRLVTLDRPTSAPGAWRATGPGLRSVSLPGRAPRPLRSAGYLHATTIACLAAAFEAAGLSYLTDYELRRLLAADDEGDRRLATPPATDGVRRIPDLLVTAGEDVAIEIELTAKSRERTRAILAGHAFAGWPVLYLVAGGSGRALTRVRSELGTAITQALRIRVRPAPIALVPRRSPRPDAARAAQIAAELARHQDAGS